MGSGLKDCKIVIQWIKMVKSLLLTTGLPARASSLSAYSLVQRVPAVFSAHGLLRYINTQEYAYFRPPYIPVSRLMFRHAGMRILSSVTVKETQ